MKTYTRSRRGLQARVIEFTFPFVNVTSFSNYCPFFWLSILALVFSPVAGLWKLMGLLQRGVGFVLKTAFMALATYVVAPIVNFVGRILPFIPKLARRLLGLARRAAQPVIEPACAVYERDRYWNEERIGQLASTPAGALTLYKVSESVQGSNCKLGITSDQFQAKITPYKAKLIEMIIANLKRETYEYRDWTGQIYGFDQVSWDRDNNPDHWATFEVNYLLHVLRRQVEDNVDLTLVDEPFIEQMKRTYKRVLAVLSPVALGIIYLIGSSIGWLVFAGILGGMALTAGAGAGLCWGIPYAIAVYKRLCPPLEWD